jgi:hypothetical protein
MARLAPIRWRASGRAPRTVARDRLVGDPQRHRVTESSFATLAWTARTDRQRALPVQSGRHPGNGSSRFSGVRSCRPRWKHRLGTLDRRPWRHALVSAQGEGRLTPGSVKCEGKPQCFADLIQFIPADMPHERSKALRRDCGGLFDEDLGPLIVQRDRRAKDTRLRCLRRRCNENSREQQVVGLHHDRIPRTLLFSATRVTRGAQPVNVTTHAARPSQPKPDDSQPDRRDPRFPPAIPDASAHVAAASQRRPAPAESPQRRSNRRP